MEYTNRPIMELQSNISILPHGYQESRLRPYRIDVCTWTMINASYRTNRAYPNTDLFARDTIKIKKTVEIS